MKVFLEHIRSHEGTSKPDSVEATLQLRVGSRIESFVVRIRTTPVLGIEAPDSLWRVLQARQGGTRALLGAVDLWLSGERANYPTSLGEDNGVSPTVESKHLWPHDTRYSDSVAQPELSWAARHLSLDRSNTLFPRPFEHETLLLHQHELLPVAGQIDLLNHRFEEPRQVVAPKSTVGTRLASQLDPLDALLLTAFVGSCGELVERARVPIGDGIVHSFRFSPTTWGGLWDADTGYGTFEAATIANAEAGSVRFVVETDVADFYHRIPIQFIASQLERLGLHPRRAESAGALLGSIGDVGLPVGPSVSAFFAEVAMTAIDNQLLAAGIRYTRFNDDFRLFCRTEVQAVEHLVQLSEILAALGLTVQSEKTRVSAASEFRENRHKSSEWWLRKAGKDLVAIDAYDEPSEANVKLSHSATSVLLKSLSEDHVAWLKLTRPALRAIIPDHKPTVIPVLLTEIVRAWPLASDIAYVLRGVSIEAHPRLREVPARFVAGVSKAKDQHALDFALLWILDALRREDWPERESLLPLLGSVPLTSVARRELLMALDDVVDHGVSLSASDHWARRYEATRGRVSDVHGLHSTQTAADKFRRRLLEMIAATV